MTRRQRILLVEDSLTQALRLEDMFDRAGYAVSLASSAAQALDELNRSLPDLMILDYHLPDMRGDELCRQIRLNVGTFSMPIIVLTADQSPEAQRAGLESGADDFLPKSALDSMILLRVRNQLRHTDRNPDNSMALPRAAFRKAEVLVVGAPAERAADLDEVLREEGCRVEHVADAGAGTRRAADRPFDCIIVGELLPDGDGLEVSLRLQSAAIGGPALLLLLRGPESAGRTRAALEMGLDDCIEPQPDYAVLRARLRATLRRRFLAEQNRRILDDYLSRERESLKLRAERAEAEARAALADELRMANDRLQEAYGRLEHQAAVTRTITESVSSALFMVDQAGLPTFANPAAEALLGCGLDRLQGRPLAESIGLPGGGDGIAALRDGPAELVRIDGTRVPVIMSVAHLRQGGMVVQMVDVTERRRAEQRQAILMAELSHRVKNTLATVNSIAAQTRQRHQDTDAFWAAFSGRLQALSSTHNLLARHHWGEVELSQLLTSEAAPYRDEQRGNLRLDGPPVQLSPKAALALGMAVHELATNAAKYGAFSTPDGRVELTWCREAADKGPDRLLITWKERGGPPVSPPSHTGFGSRLIRSGLNYELGGSAKQDFRPDGLLVTFRVPLSEHVRVVA